MDPLTQHSVNRMQRDGGRPSARQVRGRPASAVRPHAYIAAMHPSSPRLSALPAPRALRRALASCLAAGGLALCAASASAHDTWFEVRTAPHPSALWLGTGDRFPVLESRIEFTHLQGHGCIRHADLAVRGAAAGRPLSPISGPAGRLPQALSLRLPRAGGEGSGPDPLSCWASLVPFEIELEAAKVPAYLDEIAAGPALRAAWAAEQAAGRPWRERFVKHARVEVGGASALPLGLPLGLPLEAVLSGAAFPRVGQPLRFQLRQGGEPLVGQPVQLVNERSPLGLWRRTDANGQIELALPLAGRWLLRSTLLRPPAQPGERWQSDFVTLAFEVAPGAP
jgi:hypothetical protein